MIEKLTVHFIGVLCIRSYDVISNVKVLEHPQILNGVDSNNNLLYVHAIQGHSGAELIALELNVAIPLRWKDFHHVGSTSTVDSLQAGLIAGGKDAEEGQTVFFTPLDPCWCGNYDDFTKPRKVHCKNKWNKHFPGRSLLGHFGKNTR